METSQTKEDLLGVVSFDPTNKVGEIDLEILKNKEDSNSVISAFCSNCGSYHEVGYLDAEKILMTLNQPIGFENKYFVFRSCPICKGEDKTVELKSF
jgi:hypothetical protein